MGTTREANMAVSARTQAGFYGDHADETIYVKTEEEAEKTKAFLRGIGLHRKVSSYKINDGTRANPRWEYKVCAWRA